MTEVAQLPVPPDARITIVRTGEELRITLLPLPVWQVRGHVFFLIGSAAVIGGFLTVTLVNAADMWRISPSVLLLFLVVGTLLASVFATLF